MREADENRHQPIVEALLGSDLYRQSLCVFVRRSCAIRSGCRSTEEELADDALRRHFCALSHGVVVGSVSLKPLDEETLQLRQMAVAEDRRREGIGARASRARGRLGDAARASCASC